MAHWKSFSRWLPRFAILSVVGVGIAAFVHGLCTDQTGPQAPDPWATKWVQVPPQSTSQTLAGNRARLTPDTRVIGVSIGNRHRAYPLKRLSQSRNHIVNDLLDGKAFAVAYCDRTECSRLFTSDQIAGPLDLAVGGWLNQDGATDMLVRIGPNRYRLKTGESIDPSAPPFPYQSFEMETTTWHEWFQAHPDTDVFIAAVPINLHN